MRERYHFIAIGGIGMSGLAKYLLENGYGVSGSDINNSKYIAKLEDLGAKIFIGHDEDNLPDDCVVVASTAIKESNPEIQKARRLGLKVLHRSDVLAKVSNTGKFFLGYSGTHGKTTTSGFASYVLEKAGLKPSYVVGGILPEIGTNAHCQDGKFFCAELDESDGTIVKYSPNVVVVNNLEEDHLDFYKNGMDSILATFKTFLGNLNTESVVLANADNQGVCELMKKYSGKVYTYGLNTADYQAQNIEYNEDFTTYKIYFNNEFLSDMKICLKGVHNVYNSLAVFASLHQAGVELAEVLPHFATFSGMGRRFEKICEFDGISVYDDYAHHPTEIKATLSATKSFKDKNIIAVFQPHRYTRLSSLWQDFLNSFDGVNKVVVTDVYAASETPLEGINSENFVNELDKKQSAEYISGDIKTVAKKLLPTLKSGDVVIGLGAGTITNLGKELLALETTKIGN
ncbi:UDP-N-acetylmuramate--L-alanine ligase [bacterium]|nr:UDP-N-acetylmuramate--L-alanine ligase [bacterium]